MTTSAVSDVLRDAVLVVLRISAPMLLLSMLVGVVVAIFQAVTQIHEQTIGFVLKLVVIVVLLLLGGGWMLENLQDFSRQILSLLRLPVSSRRHSNHSIIVYKLFFFVKYSALKIRKKRKRDT